MSNDKIFVGNGKTYGQYGQIGISICIDKLPEEFITTDKAGNRWIKLNITEKRAVDNYGNTHSVSVNTWKPENEC